MKRLVSVLLLVLPLVAVAQLYRWIDDSGRVQVGPVAPAQFKVERVDLSPNSAAAVLPQKTQLSATEQAAKSPVVMYATSWCGYCRKAREYFKAQGIPYIEYDIEKDKSAYQRYKKLGGRGVPVISIGSETMFGFSPQKFERIYQK